METEDEGGYPPFMLVGSDGVLVRPHFRRCKSKSFSAADPVGELVRPFSMSLIDEGAKSTSLPMSASVSPLVRRSEIISDQSVMSSSLRDSVISSQRVPVTEFRDNLAMPLPPDIPKDLKTPGDRVRWWRERRGYTQAKLCELAKVKQGTLSGLETNDTKKGTFLHNIATALGLRTYYVETGKGEPEIGYEAEPLEPEPWPFQAVKPKDLNRLNKIELSYAESALQHAIEEIEQERRKAKRIGV